MLLKGEGERPTVAVDYVRRVRAGTALDLDIGSFSQGATLLVGGDAGEFHNDSNFVVSEQEADPARRAQFGESLSVTHDLLAERLDNKLELSGEIWHYAQPLVQTTREGVLASRNHAVRVLWALGYSLRPNLVFDAGFDRGLTSTSTAWQGLAGVTYLLPDRLWPDKAKAAPKPGHHVHRR